MYPSVVCPYCCTFLDPGEHTCFRQGLFLRVWPTIRYEDKRSSAALCPRGYKDRVQLCPKLAEGCNGNVRAARISWASHSSRVARSYL